MLPEFIIRSDGLVIRVVGVASSGSRRGRRCSRRRAGRARETSMPLSPRRLRLERRGHDLAGSCGGRSSTEAGGAWPSYFSSAGLGSKVSTCDGPPFMNRKITRFARAGKWGDRGAIGSAGIDASPPAGPARADVGPPSRPASARTLPRPSAPNPPPIRLNSIRRLIGSSGLMPSPDPDRPPFACMTFGLPVPRFPSVGQPKTTF